MLHIPWDTRRDSPIQNRLNFQTSFLLEKKRCENKTAETNAKKNIGFRDIQPVRCLS